MLPMFIIIEGGHARYFSVLIPTYTTICKTLKYLNSKLLNCVNCFGVRPSVCFGVYTCSKGFPSFVDPKVQKSPSMARMLGAYSHVFYSTHVSFKRFILLKGFYKALIQDIFLYILFLFFLRVYGNKKQVTTKQHF
jgi:hypothetical protein